MEPIADRVISASINEFCVLSGLGRTKVYELLDAGELRSIHVGKRRLVLIDSYREYRTWLHARDLQQAETIADDSTFPRTRAAVRALWAEIFG